MIPTQENNIPIGLLKACFESEHYPELFKGHTTDDATLRLVGQLVFYTKDKDYIRSIVQSGLPTGYKGDTLERLDGMIDRSLEKGFDEREENKKPSVATSCLKIVMAEDIELFHDKYKTPCISFFVTGQGAQSFYLSSALAKLRLKKIIYDKLKRAVPSQPFKEVLSTLAALAVFEGKEKEIHLRVARHDNSIVINLANDEGRFVVIDAKGYKIKTETPVAYINSSSMAPLPAPAQSTNSVFQEFQTLFSIPDDVFERIMAFIINCLKPDGPYLMLIIEGEQGSGKSEISRAIKVIVDPSNADKLRMPNSERDLMIMAKGMHLLVFDNLSGMSANMSDAFCSLLTGGGYSTRKLYTDDESSIFYETRPIIINGIIGIATRPDLLERSLSIRLPTIPKGRRKTEAEIRDQFNNLLPRLMGALFDVISYALANHDDTKTPTSVRMADAAKWLVASEPATGLPEGSLLKAIEHSQRDIVVESMHGNSLAVALMKLMEEKGKFSGTVGQLYEAIKDQKDKYDRLFPPTAAHLSKTLKRLRPALEKVNIIIEFGVRNRKGQMIRVWNSQDGSFENAPQIEDPFPM